VTHADSTTYLFGTITRLTFGSVDAAARAGNGLHDLLADVRGRPGFRAGYTFRTGDTELVLVTIYTSETAAQALSAEFRPRLTEIVGALVAAPPERWAGAVEANTDAD
jgi:hypothetical protein